MSREMVNQENKIVFDEQEFRTAFQDLTKSSFAVWSYLVTHKTINKDKIMASYNISERTYQRSIKELKEKGYIKNNTFYARPQVENETTADLYMFMNSFIQKNKAAESS